MDSVVQFAVVVALLIVVVYAIYRKVPISLRGGPVQLDVSQHLQEIKDEVEKINKAVNNVPTNSPSLVNRVEQMEGLGYWSADALHQIAKHVGLVLPDPPNRRSTSRG